MWDKTKYYLNVIARVPLLAILKYCYRIDPIKLLETYTKMVENQNRRILLENAKSKASDMPLDEKAKINQRAELQNEIFKVYIKFSEQIRMSSGKDMDVVGMVWAETVLGLNKTLKLSFSVPDDVEIKQRLYSVEEELQIAIDSNQEVLNTKPKSSEGEWH